MVGPPMMGPPMMEMGPCLMCGNPAPPMIIYEINMTGWIVILAGFITCAGLGGLIAACIICGDKYRPDSCHDPKGKCATCGAHRMG